MSTTRKKEVPIQKKIEIFEEFLKIGEPLTRSTVFNGYPIGLWAIQIRYNLKYANQNKKNIPNYPAEYTNKLRALGILERQIDSTLDEKIDAVIAWMTEFPKAKLQYVSKLECILREYSNSTEEYEQNMARCVKMQKYYKYIYIRQRAGKLTNEQFLRCKEANLGKIFGYPSNIENLAREYRSTRK